jgi:hypothetical protein
MKPGPTGKTVWCTHRDDTILVSASGIAHRPGACEHMTEDDIHPPGWGWKPNPTVGEWENLDSSHPVKATEGNVRRVAVRRCADCVTRLENR